MTTTQSCSLFPVRWVALSQRWALKLCTVANQQNPQQNESKKCVLRSFPKSTLSDFAFGEEEEEKIVWGNTGSILEIQTSLKYTVRKRATYANKWSLLPKKL